MSISYLGSYLLPSYSNTATLSLTIPTGATLCLIGIAYRQNTTDYTSNTMTLDGQSCSLVKWGTWNGSRENILVYRVAGFTTGASKDLIFDFDGTAAPYDGSMFMLLFFSGTFDTSCIRDVDEIVNNSTATDITTPSLDSASGDYLVGFASGRTNTISMTGGSQTEAVTPGVANDAQYDAAYKASSGSTGTLTANLATGILIGLSLKEVGGGGGTAPTITSISDSTLKDGQTGIVISGTNFSATGNTVHLNTAIDGTGTDVEQSITAEGTTEITFTVDHGTIDIGTTCYIIVENSTTDTSDGEEVLLVSDPIDMTADISVTGCTYDTDTGLVTKASSFDSNYTGRLVQVVEGGAGSFPETLVEILWADANSIMIGIGLGDSSDVDVNIFNLATGSLTNISGGMIGGVI